MSSLVLVLQSGPKPGERFTLTANEYIVGRDANADIVIADAEVSRNHARIILQQGRYLIEDLGSTNGTFINGTRLTMPVPLLPGSTIFFGEKVSLLVEAAQVGADRTVAIGQAPSSGPETVVDMPASNFPAYAPPPEPFVSEGEGDFAIGGDFIDAQPMDDSPPSFQPGGFVSAPSSPPSFQAGGFVAAPSSPPPPPRSFGGNFDGGYTEPAPPPKKNRIWLFAGIGCFVLFLCVLVPTLFLFWVDNNGMWCDVLPFIANCP